MGTEKLKFRLELYATMWNKPPVAEILVDDKSYFKDEITSTKDNPTVIEFEHECENDKEHVLTIVRSNKSHGDTVVNEKGDILKDQLLNIKDITIDDIDLGPLMYDGVYTPDYPEPWATQQKNAGNDLPVTSTKMTGLGFNGTWEIKFTSPFYTWLLEHLY